MSKKTYLLSLIIFSFFLKINAQESVCNHDIDYVNSLFDEFYSGELEKLNYISKYSDNTLKQALISYEERGSVWENIFIKTNLIEYLYDTLLIKIDEQEIRIPINKYKNTCFLFLNSDIIYQLFSVSPNDKIKFGYELITLNQQLGVEWLFKCADEGSLEVYNFLANYAIAYPEVYNEIVEYFDFMAKRDNRIYDSRDMLYMYKKRNDELITLYKEEAKNKNVNAILRLGEMYKTFSKDVNNQDIKEQAIYYYWIAAVKYNNSIAMEELGTIYRNGYGIQSNQDSAIFWLEKAVNHKYPQLTNIVLLCECFGQGQNGCKINTNKFDKYFLIADKISKEQGFIAEYLGDFFADINYHTYDLELAKYYYKMALQNGIMNISRVEKKIEDLTIKE